METVYLVRHGQTNFNMDGVIQGYSSDPPLNEVGGDQAHRLSENLSNYRFGLILSSDLQRCLQTAEIISEKTKIPIEKDKRLREIDFGEWEGQTFEKVMNTPAGKTWSAAPSRWKVSGSETLEEVQRRVVAAISDALRKTGDLLVVSHGVAIAAFILYAKGLPLDELGKHSIANAEIVKFRAAEGSFEEF